MTDLPQLGVDVHASFWRRFAAAFLDGALLSIVGGLLTGRAGIGPLLSVAYFTVLEGSASGQTLGKKLLGIRVVDLETGGPIGMTRALGRWFGRILSGIVFLIGYLSMLWDPERQTWHDKFVRAVVVKESCYPVSRWPGW
jgi:uncharacterized RDD family membrane protein YckC